MMFESVMVDTTVQRSSTNFLGNVVHNGVSVQIINNVKPSVQRRPTRRKIRNSKLIEAMIRSKEPINEVIMDIISDHLGKHWRFLFRKLGYSNGQIDQVETDFYRDNKEQIYRLLLDYSRNNNDACLGHITNLMWKNGFEECVDKLKKPWKNGELVMAGVFNSSGHNEKANFID